MPRLLTLLLAIPILLYLALVLLLALKQRTLIYPIPRACPAAPPPGFEPAQLRTPDGLTLHAAYRPAQGDRPTLIFFHGNGDTLAGAAVATARLARAGYGVLLPEYRGYGGNPGAPSERGLYLDGEAAFAWAAECGIPAERIVAVGNSLGSGVATEMAVRHRTAGLVLVSGFTSLPDAAAHHLRWLPARALVRDRYANAAKIARASGPVLILHGDADAVIPPGHAAALARRRPDATLRTIAHVGHELAYTDRAQAEIVDWLAAAG